MRITRIEAWPVSMRLSEPYTQTFHTYEAAHNVFLKLVTDRRIVGYGCAAPAELVTGETPESVLEAIQTIVEPSIKGMDPLRSTLIMEKLRAEVFDKPAVLGAVDMALFDILGKRSRLPLWRLLGGFRSHIDTSITVGILPEEETVEQTRAWVDGGFRRIKLKGGHDVGLDAARVMQVREAVGSEVSLCFDANQGYTAEQTSWFAEQTIPARLQFIEQPTPQGDLELLGQIKRDIAIPVMADESLITLGDANRLAQGRMVDMMNVKITKVGGLSTGRQMISVAKSANIQVMIGSMDESALGVSAGLQLALACPNVAFADLDGHIGLEDDPAAEAILLKDGALYPSDKFGLGFNPPE